MLKNISHLNFISMKNKYLENPVQTLMLYNFVIQNGFSEDFDIHYAILNHINKMHDFSKELMYLRFLNTMYDLNINFFDNYNLMYMMATFFQHTLFFASPKLLRNKSFLKDIIKIRPENINYIYSKYYQDHEFIKELYNQNNLILKECLNYDEKKIIENIVTCQKIDIELGKNGKKMEKINKL